MNVAGRVVEEVCVTTAVALCKKKYREDSSYSTM